MLINNTTTTLQSTAKPFEDSILHYVLLSLAVMNFFGYGGYILLLWAAYAIVRYVLGNHAVYFDKGLIVVFFLAISVLVPACINIAAFSFGETLKVFNYILPYFIGYSGYLVSTNKEKYIKRTAAALFVGFAIYVVLILIYNYQKGVFTFGGFDFVYSLNRKGERMVYDIWTGGEVSATLVGLLGSVIIGCFFYAVVCAKNLWIKLGALAIMLVVFVINFTTATRTPIVLFVIVFAFLTVLFIAGSAKEKALGLIAAFLLAACVLLFVYHYDLFGVQTYLTSTPIFDRFKEEGVRTNRADISMQHLDLMFDYLWGGNHIYGETHSLAHNFIQEAHDLYGIVSTVNLVAFSLIMLYNMCRLIFMRKKQPVIYLLIGLSLSILLQCCVEPVFQGYPILFWCLILVQGLCSAYLKEKTLSTSKEDVT